MSTGRGDRVYLFSRFERLWHWTQAALIFAMLVTGFDLHGTWNVMPFETAFAVHVWSALALMVVWAFAVFWHLTTGEWRQYVPTFDRLFAVVRYYAFAIFKGETHPFQKTPQRKHNALQRLAYLGLHVAITPAVWVSGLLLLTWDWWNPLGTAASGFGLVAVVHTAAAFAMALFVVVHVYMIFTAKPLHAYLVGMITGYERVHH